MDEITIRLRQARSLLRFVTENHTTRFGRGFNLKVEVSPRDGTESSEYTLVRPRLERSQLQVPLAPVPGARMTFGISLVSGLRGREIFRFPNFDVFADGSTDLAEPGLELIYVADWGNALIQLRNDLLADPSVMPLLAGALAEPNVDLFDLRHWQARLLGLAAALEEADDLAWDNLAGQYEDKIDAATQRLSFGAGSRMALEADLFKADGSRYGTARYELELRAPPAVPPPSTTRPVLKRVGFDVSRPGLHAIRLKRKLRMRSKLDTELEALNLNFDPRDQFLAHAEMLRAAMLLSGQQPAFEAMQAHYSKRVRSTLAPREDFGAGAEVLPAIRPCYVGGFHRPYAGLGLPGIDGPARRR